MRDILLSIVADFNFTFSCGYEECVDDTIPVLDDILTVKIRRILTEYTLINHANVKPTTALYKVHFRTEGCCSMSRLRPCLLLAFIVRLAYIHT